MTAGQPAKKRRIQETEDDLDDPPVGDLRVLRVVVQECTGGLPGRVHVLSGHRLTEGLQAELCLEVAETRRR